jgi:TolA-binding protein
MPTLISLNEQYREKGLVLLFVGYESKAKLEPFTKKYKITWPVAIDPTKKTHKSYGVRAYPTTFLIAPNGKIAWQGHHIDKKFQEIFKALLPKVKNDSGLSGADTESSTKVKLREVTKGLQFAAKQAAKGKLASALRMAEKTLDQANATEKEKEDAKYIKEEVEKRASELNKEVDRLLKEKSPYEARELLIDIRRAFSGSDHAKKAQERIDSINNDEKLAKELEAGKLYTKALKYQTDGKEDSAKKTFQEVIDKYPETEYAKRAKAKLK